MKESGKVITHFTQNGKRHTVLERSADNLAKDPNKEKRFVVIHDGSQQKNVGENQFFDELETAPNKYVSTKGDEMETYIKPTTQTKGTTTFVPEEGLDQSTKSLEVDFKLSPISDYAAVEIVKASWDLALKFYNYKDERKDFLKIVKQLQFDLVKDMCNVMNKCETGDKNFFNQ